MDTKDTKGPQDQTVEEAWQSKENANADFLDDVQPREKELMRKVDWRLLPILGALYAIALIDRVNVCNFPFYHGREELR